MGYTPSPLGAVVSVTVYPFERPIVYSDPILLPVTVHGDCRDINDARATTKSKEEAERLFSLQCLIMIVHGRCQQH